LNQERCTLQIGESVKSALKIERVTLVVLENETNKVYHFRQVFLMDPKRRISYDEPQPNIFSFNSPYGAAQHATGWELKALSMKAR